MYLTLVVSLLSVKGRMGSRVLKLPKTQHVPIISIDRVFRRQRHTIDLLFKLAVVNRLLTHLTSPLWPLLPAISIASKCCASHWTNFRIDCNVLLGWLLAALKTSMGSTSRQHNHITGFHLNFDPPPSSPWPWPSRSLE